MPSVLTWGEQQPMEYIEMAVEEEATTLATSAGDVALESQCGRGTSSQVFKGWTTRGEVVALKVGASVAHAARFASEAERLLFAQSPHLARVLGAGRLKIGTTFGETTLVAGSPYLVLGWREGASLKELLARGRVTSTVALTVLQDVAAALEHLHATGTSHGDVKPGNIIVEEEGDAVRVSLIDLGLAAPVGAPGARGGTPRYLAPELFEPGSVSDGRARDLYALGLVVAECLSPALVRAQDLQGAIGMMELPSVAAPLLHLLLASTPGARPSASWVRARSSMLLDAGEEDPERAREERRAAIRRSYLSQRREELVGSRLGHPVEVAVSGVCGVWLAETRDLCGCIAELRGSGGPAPTTKLKDLDPLLQRRWLVKLVGPAAAHWPPLGEASDSALVGRVTHACEELTPESLTFRHVLDSATSALPKLAAIELAFRLRDTPVDPEVLRQVEDDTELEPALTLEAARALRLRGEFGRALALLRRLHSPEATLECAEIARRTGDRQGALELLDGLNGATSASRSRALAIRTRLLVDHGKAAEALSTSENAQPQAGVLEARALAWLAMGNTADAAHCAERAHPLAQTEEEHARVAGVEGMIAHAVGDADRALERFARAAEHAERAGAVLEEATYLTGVAAAATSLGAFGTALETSERAMLLFECLGRSKDAARALLSKAAIFSALHVPAETAPLADETVRVALQAGDKKCAAYAYLAKCDALERRSGAGRDAVERARQLLGDASSDDTLRVDARGLLHGERVDAFARDELALRSSTVIDARLDWWRARSLLLLDAPGQAADVVLRELTQLASVCAPVVTKGEAMAAGAQLALSEGDANAARRLLGAAAAASRDLFSQLPDNLRRFAESLDWVTVSHSEDGSNIAPEQLSDVENLVRTLGCRASLKALLNQVLDALVLWTGVERGLLLLRAPGGRLIPRAARNLARLDLHPEQRKLSYSLAERAVEERQPVVAVDAATELSEMHDSVHSLKLRSVLALPLVARGDVLGVVYLDDRERRGAFGSRELSWVKLVSTIAAVAIADARDQLLLRRAARKAVRAENRLARELAMREAALEVAERQLAHDRKERSTRFRYEGIVGQSAALDRMLSVVDRVTASDVPVLIVGESGSGKELVARSIHDNGARGSAPFVSENCAAIPETLLESALFGHVRGAFTGASRTRVGLFESADGGTLFLDEIGEMPLGMQVKLLRVLESGEIRAVGSERSRKVDVRIIAATNRDLAKMVESGEFREDLLYRLNVITVDVPPLRDRAGDLELLVRHFIARHSSEPNVRLEQSALAALKQFSWPGNIRQLENEVRRFLVLVDGPVTREHLSPEITGSVDVPANDTGLNLKRRVDALETQLVRSALEQTGGNQTRAAEILGLSRFGLQKMIKRLGIVATRVSGRPVGDRLNVRR